MAAQSVPNTMVRNKQDGSTMVRPQPNASSLEVALQKYPHASSFLDFSSGDLKSLLNMTTFNLFSLRSLSLSLDGRGLKQLRI
jgi:hypothetical protein